MSTPPFLALPPGARSCRMPTARGEFAVHEAGEARLGTVLLVPGFTGSKEDFIGLLGPLSAAGLRVVAVDGRGQYETGGPRTEDAYSRAELALDTLALAEAAGGGSPVHLLGHSLGGLVARAAVLRDAGPFASLTLLSSGPAAVAESQRRRLELLLGALRSMEQDDIWQAMQELDPDPAAAGEVLLSAVEGDAPASLAAFLRRRWVTNIPEQLMATGRQLMNEPDRVGELAEVPLDKHVVSGAVDDAWPVALLDEMATRLHAHRSVVPGSGHSPNAEQPAATARALAGFWLAPSRR